MTAGGDVGPNGGTVLATRSLRVRARDRLLLDDINLDFQPRSLTAIVGASGCGKTTFVRSLNRLVEMTPGLRVEGSVTYLGQELYGPGVNPVLVRRRIGMVFQRPTVFPKSIFENAAFGLRLVGTDEEAIDTAVASALGRAGLWEEVKDDLDRPALSLSGGQQQRLCIARALATRPRVLLLDEPTSAIDPTGTERIEETMRRLKEECVLILVTHNIGQAARVSDRLAFLSSGHLVEVGPTADVLERPTDPRTEAFVTRRYT